MSLPVFGKGRPRKSRPTIDTVPRISVRDLARVPSTASRASGTSVRVVIDGKPETIDVVFDDRNYGGRGQPYFLCGTCSRKCRHLYLRDDPRDWRRLACRQCSGVVYASQHTRRRGLNRVRRLRAKIGALPSPLASIPQRPRYVRRDYWARALARIAAAETLVAGELHDMLVRVRRRLAHERHRDRDSRARTA